MLRLRDKWNALTTLLDWQNDEVVRAYEQSRVYAAEDAARRAAAKQYEAEKNAYAEAWYEKHGPRAVILDLDAYRAKRASA